MHTSQKCGRKVYGWNCLLPKGHAGDCDYHEVKCQCKGISIEQMQKDLVGGGWEKWHGSTWKSLSGAIYLGPVRAWHVWAGIPMCAPATETRK